jgi:hypothetical protein
LLRHWPSYYDRDRALHNCWTPDDCWTPNNCWALDDCRVLCRLGGVAPLLLVIIPLPLLIRRLPLFLLGFFVVALALLGRLPRLLGLLLLPLVVQLLLTLAPLVHVFFALLGHLPRLLGLLPLPFIGLLALPALVLVNLALPLLGRAAFLFSPFLLVVFLAVRPRGRCGREYGKRGQKRYTANNSADGLKHGTTPLARWVLAKSWMLYS